MERLKTLRREKGMTQAEMAKLLGVSQVTFLKYEKGSVEPNQESLKKLADYFHVSTDYLLGKSDLRYYPILGEVSAGEGCLAEENIIGYQMFDYASTDDEKLYVLVVKGESMTPYFLPGDKVLVRMGNFEPEKNVKYIVLIGDVANMKLVEVQSGGLLLTAYNQEVYSPHFYSGKECVETPVRIIGRVVSLQRDV